MHKKSSAGTGTYSIIFGVAFVWFTTHFGGGFASGRWCSLGLPCLHAERRDGDGDIAGIASCAVCRERAASGTCF